MIPIRNSLKGTLEYIKSALTRDGSLSRTSVADTNFIPMASPFVTVNGSDTKAIFAYGISEYGGEDIVMGPESLRLEKRHFLDID